MEGVFLCYRTDDQHVINICNRYWALGPQGLWHENVDPIALDAGVPKHSVVKFIQQACTAFSIRARCGDCGTPVQVKSRTDFAASKKFAPKCEICYEQEKARRAQQIAQQQEDKRASELAAAAEIRQQLLEINEALLPCDYQSLDFVTSALLYAALTTAGEAWQDATLLSLDCQANSLTPTLDGSIAIYKRLKDAGILCLSPSSPHGSVIIEGDRLAYYPPRVNWTLAEDSEGIPWSDLLTVLEVSFHSPTAEELESLWHIVATEECKAYLFEMYAKYKFFDAEYSDRIAESINYALQYYPIPKVWNIISFTLLKLAALMQAGTHTKKHVYNMIPGNIRRSVDKLIADNREIRSWTRRSETKEAFLTGLLFDKILGGGTDDFNSVTSANIHDAAERLGNIPY